MHKLPNITNHPHRIVVFLVVVAFMFFIFHFEYEECKLDERYTLHRICMFSCLLFHWHLLCWKYLKRVNTCMLHCLPCTLCMFRPNDTIFGCNQKNQLQFILYSCGNRWTLKWFNCLRFPLIKCSNNFPSLNISKQFFINLFWF